MSTPGEWVAWHRGYDDPGSAQARRLATVQRLIAGAIDRAPAGEIRIVGMCAGDGRDLVGALHGHPRARDVRARLVEIDATLAARGREQSADLAAIEFVVGDASVTSAYAGAVPADVVLVCGVFGNVTDSDVHNTVAHLAELCAPDATVVWTRGRFEPDLTPSIRRWFSEAGFEEVEFVSLEGTTAAAGAHRLVATPRTYVAGERLFRFLPAPERPSRGAL